MSEFNNMTITSACSILVSYNTHSEMSLLEVEWGIDGRVSRSSKPQRAADLAAIAIREDIQVHTLNGQMSLARAMIECTLQAPDYKRSGIEWKKFVAGLLYDGFEIVETEIVRPARRSWMDGEIEIERTLNRLYPDDVPGLDFKDAENEIFVLLDRHDLSTSKGHLRQAIQNFTNGNWAAANGQMRTFFESYMVEIALRLDYSGKPDSARDVRAFLGKIEPPMLLVDFNEWNSNDQKPQFVSGMWARMHPEGSHPGLSEQDDCAFRLHLVLISARLFLRRFDRR